MLSTCETEPSPKQWRVFWLSSKCTTHHPLYTVITWGTQGKEKHSGALPGRIHFPNYWLESKLSLPNHYAHFLPKIELWPVCAWQTRLNSNWDESVMCTTGPWIAFPIRNLFILIITYCMRCLASAICSGRRRGAYFCSDGGKWGQSVWGLFFWVSKELTVNSTQELPWQVWVLAAGCTWGVSLKNKTSINQLKNTCDYSERGWTHYRIVYILFAIQS